MDVPMHDMLPPEGRTVAVLMSGGVDSSVAAYLLQRAGWRVLGFTMNLRQASPLDPRFTGESDVERVCSHLGIEHAVFDLSDEFEQAVVEPFRQAYREGRTPNPCVNCNPAMKFGRLWDRIRDASSTDFVATGHYARILRDGDVARLARGADPSKDQAYFLYRIPRARLEGILFPLGSIESKETTRRIARDAGIPVAEHAESMEICFVPDDNYRSFLGEDEASPGPIIDRNGDVLGQHTGIIHYTVGQRRGLGKGFGQPMYVLRIIPKQNAIVIGPREQAYRREVWAVRPNVLIPEALRPDARGFAKIRSAGDTDPCNVIVSEAERLAVCFDEPVYAPTAGQHLVLYDKDGCVIAGGEITEDV